MAITLKQALTILDNGDWVNMQVVTADLKKGTGGKLLTLPKCRIARNPGNAPKASNQSAPKSPADKLDESHKFTRQVELPNKNIITIHPPLIFNINNNELL